MFGIGLGEWIVILLVVALFFGARRIPELAKGLGQGIRGFQSALRGDDERKAPRDDARAAPTAPAAPDSRSKF